MVCSAYETPVEKTSKRRCFSYIEDGKKHFVQSTDVTSQMFLENGCCYVLFGKSWLALWLAVTVAKGRNRLGAWA